MREIDMQTTTVQSTGIRLGGFLHKKHNCNSTQNAKMFFFGILINDLDFRNKLNKTIAVFYHVIMRLLCFVKGCLFEQRKNPTALLHVPDWPELSLVEKRDCPHLGTGVQCCVRSDRFEKKILNTLYLFFFVIF